MRHGDGRGMLPQKVGSPRVGPLGHWDTRTPTPGSRHVCGGHHKAEGAAHGSPHFLLGTRSTGRQKSSSMTYNHIPHTARCILRGTPSCRISHTCFCSHGGLGCSGGGGRRVGMGECVFGGVVMTHSRSQIVSPKYTPKPQLTPSQIATGAPPQIKGLDP